MPQQYRLLTKYLLICVFIEYRGYPNPEYPRGIIGYWPVPVTLDLTGIKEHSHKNIETDSPRLQSLDC